MRATTTNKMKNYVVLRQFKDWTPSVANMFDEYEDADTFAKLLQKNEKENIKYWVFEMSK